MRTAHETGVAEQFADEMREEHRRSVDLALWQFFCDNVCAFQNFQARDGVRNTV
jgi:hypothetical protein